MHPTDHTSTEMGKKKEKSFIKSKFKHAQDSKIYKAYLRLHIVNESVSKSSKRLFPFYIKHVGGKAQTYKG